PPLRWRRVPSSFHSSSRSANIPFPNRNRPQRLPLQFLLLFRLILPSCSSAILFRRVQDLISGKKVSPPENSFWRTPASSLPAPEDPVQIIFLPFRKYPRTWFP